jgi:uncharacterized protein YegL
MLDEFVRQDIRPLPVLLLLDVSGSMSFGGKIEALNESVRAMVETFAQETNTRAEIQVGIITFGGESKLAQELTAAKNIRIQRYNADGGTPLGGALEIAKNLLEDRDKVPSRAYRPTVIMVSDGQPTDQYEKQLRDFIETGRSSKCHRMAIGIGQDADIDMMETFLDNEEMEVLQADSTRDIVKHFRFISMSTIAQINSKTPNKFPGDPKATPDVSKGVNKIDRFADINFDDLF